MFKLIKDKFKLIYIILLCIPVIILFFSLKKFDYSIIEKADTRNDGYTELVVLERNFSQDFYVSENNLRQINLYCGMYGNFVDSILDVKITDKQTKEIIYDNKIFTSGITEDNSTTPIYFDIQENSKGKWYNINITCIQSNTGNGFSFALIKSAKQDENGVDLTPSHIYSQNNDGIVINDVSQDLSFKMDYIYANTNIKLKIMQWSIIILSLAITICMILAFIDKKENKLEDKIQIVINILILAFFILMLIIWITSNKIIVQHPDELMRISLPFYIYENNELPLPRDPDVLSGAFNASYAYYPLFLTSIIAAGFMKIATIFGFTSNFELVVAARMVSLLSGVISVVFLMKICKKLFKNDIVIRNIAVIIGAFIPQFVYLSSYFNNDIPSVCASTIMVYAWILVLENGWNIKRAILLSIGIIICALSYYNAYSWILLSVIIFILSFIKKNANGKEKVSKEKNIKIDNENKAIEKIDKKNSKYIFDTKNFFKYGIIITVIVLIFISYFFIRNIIILDGDLLGIDSFLEACEEGAIESQKPSNRDNPKNRGYSYWHMLTSTEWNGSPWYKATYQSFICLLRWINSAN